jgi:hypothetical protein
VNEHAAQERKTASPFHVTEAVLVAVVWLAALVPFVGRAFNVDEPLFVWTAQHVAHHPLDFFGFTPARNADATKWSAPVTPGGFSADCDHMPVVSTTFSRRCCNGCHI